MLQEVIIATSSKEDTVTIIDTESYSSLFQFKESYTCVNGISLIKNRCLDPLSVINPGFVALQTNRNAVNMYKWGKIQPVFKCNLSEKLTCSCTSEDGIYLFLGSLSGKIYIYSILTGELLQTFDAHYKSVTTIVYMDNEGLLLSGGADGLLRCWSIVDIFTPQGISYNSESTETTSNSITPMFTASDHTLSITHIFAGCNPTSYIITSSLDMTVKVWDIYTFKCIYTYTLPSAVNTFCISPSQNLLFISCSDANIYVLNISFANINSLGYSYKTINIQNQKEGSNNDSIISSLKGHKAPVTTISISYDGNRLISGDVNGDIYIWDTINYKLLKSIHIYSSSITNLSYIIKPTNLLQGGEPLFSYVPLKKYPINNLQSFTPLIMLSESESISSDVKPLSESITDKSTVKFNKTYEERIEQLQHQVEQLEQANTKWQDISEQLYKKCLSYE